MLALFFGKSGLNRTTEDGGFATTFFLFFLNVGGGFVDQLQREFVALATGIRPVDEAVLAHDESFSLRVLFAGFLHRQTEFKTGAHPRNVNDLVTIDRFRHLNAIRTSGNRDGGIRVGVIDVSVRDEAVQRRVDGRGTRVEVEGAMREHGDHIVLGLRFDAFVWAGCIKFLKSEKLGLVERGKVLLLGSTKITARSLHPKNLEFFTGDWVFVFDF